MQKFIKLGTVIKACPTVRWCSHYAGSAFAEVYDDEAIRIYFSGTSDERVSRIGYFETDSITSDPGCAKIKTEPILDIGRPGCFDENGVDAPCIVNIDENTKYLYYCGWVKGGHGGYFVNTGLAVSEDNGESFKRVSEAPVLERTNDEPIGTSSCCVRKDGNIFKMWYTSYDKWEYIAGRLVLFFKIRYAESTDGIIWKRNFSTAINYRNSDENVTASPCVIIEKGIYKMWYSYRTLNSTYRIGYAESKNGIDWERMDSVVGLDVGRENEWDSDMVEYPHVFDYKNERFMLYCGNSYGKTGIGAARFV